MNLLEAYRKRLAVANEAHKASHNGQPMSESKKLVIAKVLKNTNEFLNEAFENSVGTNRADMGLFKKFSMNLVNVALPNLIAFDLVIVYPMSSMSGYINYIEYVAGSNKGATTQGTVLNSPFQLGAVDPTYTSSQVVEASKATPSQTEFGLKWAPVVPGSIVITVTDTDGANAKTYYDDGKGKLISLQEGTTITKRFVATQGETDGTLSGVAGAFEVSTTGTGTEDKGTVEYGLVSTRTLGGPVYDTKTAAKVTFSEGITENYNVSISYLYNNVVIPQNDLPVLSAQMKAIPLIAHARRIAIYYSQIAAFQAKTDYGFDLGEQLAEKAVGQLSYEIDTEVVNLLDTTAGEATPELTWGKNQPVGISKAEHFEGFSELVGIAKQIIYDRTKRFAPNYMIISSSLLPILGFLRNWTPAPAGKINGPYFAGTLEGLKVFVSPAMARGRFVIGVNGDDMMSSAAVYAPYMPIVPTQLLGFADGGMSQGWSTLYALEVLNKNLLVAGQVKDFVNYNKYVGGVVSATVGYNPQV